MASEKDTTTKHNATTKAFDTAQELGRVMACYLDGESAGHILVICMYSLTGGEQDVHARARSHDLNQVVLREVQALANTPTTVVEDLDAEAESIPSIKLNAPLDYSTQGRAVTADDFKVYTRKLFANTQAVSVWGGEDGSFDAATGLTSSTPEYGKVFISVKTTTGENMTVAQKFQLEKDLIILSKKLSFL